LTLLSESAGLLDHCASRDVIDGTVKVVNAFKSQPDASSSSGPLPVETVRSSADG
jgi:hypothetical protein